MNTYIAYGTIFRSELELPELIVHNEKADADVNIVIGKVPEHLYEVSYMTPWFEVAKEQYLLKVDGVAKYYVNKGVSIIIELQEDVSLDLVRLFLLNSVLPQLLLQRGYLVFHGSTAIINNSAVLLLGGSCTGISSLAFKLFEEGHKILSDENCCLHSKDGKMWSVPGIPQLNIWADTLKKQNKELESYKRLRQELEKYAIPVNSKFNSEIVEVKYVIIMEHNNENKVLCNTIKGAKKLEKMFRNSKVYETTVDNKQHFECMIALGKVSFLEISFNEKLYPLKEIVDLLEKECV